VPNKSEILRALEWVDRAARDGEALMLDKARRALEEEIHSTQTSSAPDAAYKTAVESFVRKHGREPLEDIRTDED
jgi:hypothetical protein